jgi:hypothetical protein
MKAYIMNKRSTNRDFDETAFFGQILTSEHITTFRSEYSQYLQEKQPNSALEYKRLINAFGNTTVPKLAKADLSKPHPISRKARNDATTTIRAIVEKVGR